MYFKKLTANNLSIKAKSIILVLGVLILISLILTWLLIVYKNTEIRQKIESHHLRLEKIQNLAISKAKDKILSHLITLNHSKEFKDFIKSNNRKDLNRYMQPIYKALKIHSSEMLDIYTIYLPDGTSFLRLHKPDVYGDNNLQTRTLLRQASETKEVMSGFEVGKFGVFYRIEYPVIFDSEIIAIIDIGLVLKELDLTLETLHKVSIVNLFPYTEEQTFNKKSSYTFEGKYMLEGSDEASKILFEFGSKNIIDGTLLHYNEKVYIVHTLSTKNNSGYELAKKIYFIDITTDYLNKKKDIWIFIAISIFVIIMLTVILLRGFNTILRQLLDSENRYKELAEDLDRKVQDQTAHMFQQSRLAQMGEMVSMIAHQWRQPLAAISSVSCTLKLNVIMDKYNKSLFEERLADIDSLSQHLSTTINDFKFFFKENKERQNSSCNSIIVGSLKIIEATLMSSNIKIHKKLNQDTDILTYPNEIMQVVLNILKNSEDAFLEKKIAQPEIWITTYSKNKQAFIGIEDNAGGIPEEIINKIFDPYFSTKMKKDGTGLGLYMSKTIIEEHCHGVLQASNTTKGARFEIILPDENGQDA